MSGIRRTATRMADGRQLIYFDDVTEHREVVPDMRDLPRVGHGPTIGFDGRAGGGGTSPAPRQARPFLPPADHCPLDPTRPGRAPTEIPATDYDVVVFE